MVFALPNDSRMGLQLRIYGIREHGGCLFFQVDLRLLDAEVLRGPELFGGGVADGGQEVEGVFGVLGLAAAAFT